jgi:hypothetical protein
VSVQVRAFQQQLAGELSRFATAVLNLAEQQEEQEEQEEHEHTAHHHDEDGGTEEVIGLTEEVRSRPM